MADDKRQASARGHDPHPLSDEERRAWLVYVRVLLRLSYEMNRELVADGGISLADYHVLNALWGAPDQRMQIRPLATRIGWERSRVSHQVRRMGKRELLRFETVSSDRRATDVILTRHGGWVYREASVGHIDLVRRLFFEGLEPGGVGPLAEALEGVYENIIAKGTLPRPDFPPD